MGYVFSVKGKLFWVLLLFLALSFPCRGQGAERILSMSPVATEILFELGLGDRVIGVTTYCDWPPEAAKKPQLADLRDANIERLISLKPDLIVVSDFQSELAARMGKLGVRSAFVRQGSIEQIYQSILSVAEACSVADKGKAKVAELKKRVSELKKRTHNKRRPSTLISVGRDLNRAHFLDSYFAGPDTAYEELLRIAGGKNVLNRSNTRVLTYPQISLEGVIHLNPEVILDLVAGHGYGAPPKGMDIRDQWSVGRGVKAVDSGRVYVIADTVVLRPGPRFPKIIEHFIRVLHPEVSLAP